MRILLLLFLTLTFAGELEVEGDLTVTGDIDSPTIDALSGMKPDRIYRYIQPDNGTYFTFIVPEGKLWRIELWGGVRPTYDEIRLAINGATIGLHFWQGPQSNFLPITLIGGDVIASNVGDDKLFTRGGLTIYEYSTSGSGSEQGMDYIEP